MKLIFQHCHSVLKQSSDTEIFTVTLTVCPVTTSCVPHEKDACRNTRTADVHPPKTHAHCDRAHRDNPERDAKLNGREETLFFSFGRRVVGWLFGGESMLGWPRAINRRLSRPSAASLIYGAPPIAPGFIWPLSNTCTVRERSPTLAGPLCILNNPDGNCPFLKC